MTRCTGLAVCASGDRRPDIGGWTFAVQGERAVQFAARGDVQVSSVIVGEAGCESLAYAVDEDLAVWMIGELYNRVALRQLLPAVAAELSDSELLLQLYRRYGKVAMRLINGRYAAMVCDGSEFVAVTDHASTIPLYFHAKSNNIYVSTEAKALALRSEYRVQLRDYEDRTYEQHASETVFHEIRRVPSGTVATFDLHTGAERLERYWQMPWERQILSEERAARLLYDSLDQAVAMRVPAQEPVGVILSGGIDSSAITSLLAGKVVKLHTFSVGTERANEFEFARLVVERCGTEHHEFMLQEADFLKGLPEVVWAAEVPQAQFIEYLIPVHLAYQLVRPYAANIVTGYGSDILFGGMLDPDQGPGTLDQLIMRDVLSTDGSNEFTHVIGSMHGVWTTHPFWDRDVLHAALQLDPALKNRNGIEKYILRKGFEHALPERNVWRKKIGIHEATGAQSVFTQYALQQGGSETTEQKKDRVIYRVLQALYAEGADPKSLALDDLMIGKHNY